MTPLISPHGSKTASHLMQLLGCRYLPRAAPAQSMDPYFVQESVDRAARSMNFAYDAI